MKVLTQKDKTIALIALEIHEKRRMTFAGTYSVGAIKAFANSLDALYPDDHKLDIFALFTDISNAYILVAEDKPDDENHIGMAGCPTGVDGDG